ncbi:MAG TPA: ABC transporter permease [Candidatus Faecimonas intestinavium]|nr:ABC transporter permease [Candidatus Faecimonas intestinavium]
MLSKLAFRNVKKSIKDYIIYLITITISFSLIFALNLVSSSEAVIELSKGLDRFAYLLYGINAIVILVISYLINYTTKFMFQKRSKEFGMYMLLGIKKKKITKMFLLENLLIGLIALLIAIPIGFLASQFVSMVIVSLLGLPQAIFIELNLTSIGLLVLYFVIIYILVLFRANRRMKKISIHELLYLEKQNEEKIMKKKNHRTIIFIISVILGVLGLYIWNSQFKLEQMSNQTAPMYLGLSMLLIIISIYGIMISVADFILSVVLNNKKIKYSKDNLFVARCFSSKARTMGFTLGTLSMLITFTLFFLNVSSINKGLYDYQINVEAPYDISVANSKENLPKFLEVIDEDYTIENEYIYDIYVDKTASILSTEAGYDYTSEDNRYDPVIKLSDYNELQELRNLDTITLNDDEYSIITDASGKAYINELDSTKEITMSNGVKLKQKEILTEGYWLGLANSTYTIIVPDDKINNLEIEDSHLVVNTKEDTSVEFETKIEEKMEDYISYINGKGKKVIEHYKISVRGALIEETNTMTTIICSICLYMAFIFIASVGTILAIQSLTDSTKYRYRYDVLNRLGVKKEKIYKTIRKQLLVLFGLPIIYPIIISFCLITSINNVYKTLLANDYIYLSYYLEGLAVFLVIYIIYYIATYFEFKRILKES